MATSSLNFTQAIDQWVKETDQRATLVFRESTQRLVSLTQSRIPVHTGFARASVRASTEAMPPINANAKGLPGQHYSFDGGNITAAIIGAQLGDTIFVGWTASYVIFLEFGHSKKAPSGFVGVSAMEWPRIVNEVTAEAKGRASL